MVELILRAPLSAGWPCQYVRLRLPGVAVGQPLAMTIDDEPADFQYTGADSAPGAVVIVRLGFDANRERRLTWTLTDRSTTNLSRRPIDLSQPTVIGCEAHRLVIGVHGEAGVTPGPIHGFAGFDFASVLHGTERPRSRELLRINDGLIFTDYRLSHRFANGGWYDLHLRCFRHEPVVEVCEDYQICGGASLHWMLNPQREPAQLLTHDDLDFQYERPPVTRPLDAPPPDDLLLRLQMPPLGMYVIPRNRGWFALVSQNKRALVGLLALDGRAWRDPTANMMRLYGREGQALLELPLTAGRRKWLLYAGAAPDPGSAGQPMVFDALHAKWNALRLDEHLDLIGGMNFDSSAPTSPGFFTDGDRQRAIRNARAMPPLLKHLRHAIVSEDQATGLDLHDPILLRYLVDPRDELAQALRRTVFARLALWVEQFQGVRRGRADYSKGIVGFARLLRRLLLAYELLRRDGRLSDDDTARMHHYFVFAGRRLTDEGRWPHQQTWLHPDHPDSVRGFYSYPGEQVPHRLVWTNSLPNFQSDPMCALAHLACLIPDHPDAPRWRRLGIEEIHRQLDAYLGPDGAWEESILYTLYTLSYFVITFRVLKHRCGINFFRDPRVRRLLDWTTRFFGPMDQRVGAFTWPTVGNTRLPVNHAEALLAYAAELDTGDPLRRDLIAVYQRCEPTMEVSSHFAAALAVMAPEAVSEPLPLRPLDSQVMRDLGVAMRHRHGCEDESYLFQKIGLFKDHYECDETSINWYARGVPLVMDYGAYTPRCATAGAHNLVEVPDMDSLARGFLADRLLSPAVDYTRCETPVILKLLHGRLRSFAEVDRDAVPPRHFYIGDGSPRGPKVWKTRLLLFVKPDYVVLFDRVVGPVPHRFNLHVTADGLRRKDDLIRATGRFGVDLTCFVHHPRTFDIDVGQFSPVEGDPQNPQRQVFVRLYNREGDTYRTALLAHRPGESARFERLGEHGLSVTTPAWRDVVFLSDRTIEYHGQGVDFVGRAGWIRVHADSRVQACVPDGELIRTRELGVEGFGPWWYDSATREPLVVQGVPRPVRIVK